MPTIGADPRAFLRDLFDRAVAAARPEEVLAEFLPEPPKGRTVVVGAGKAAVEMAQALEAAWPGDLEGVVVTRHGQKGPTTHIRVLEASHPMPDSHGMEASRAMFAAVEGLSADDLVIALISGGGSALLCLPAEGVTLEDKLGLTQDLFKAGATINELNVVRQQLSAIKGGRLGKAAAPARVVSLLISDVPGDDPSMIASGPTVQSHAGPEDAFALLRKYDVPLADHLRQAMLNNPVAGPLPHCSHKIIAGPMNSLRVAAEIAREAGITPLILSDRMEGESKEIAKAIGAMALSIRDHGQPLARPALLLSGGETTVTAGPKGFGVGGPNSEFALSLAITLQGAEGIHALLADTDGIDGVGGAAGAIIGPDILDRAREKGLDPQDFLARHDAHNFFEPLGNLLIPGATGTNVNDFRAVLVL